MYVTRPLSMYRRDPNSLSFPPPEGPNSGYLVVFDDESETYTCLGLCKESLLKNLPFPQNKSLKVEDGDSFVDVLFIPALNQPLSSNRYYAMVKQRYDKHQGKAYTSSKEEDMSIGCCGPYAKDVKPRPLDPADTYQQFEILHKKNRGFRAKSIALDGVPPKLLSQKRWTVYMEKIPRHHRLRDDARGLDASLRRSLPPLASRQVVGKWYCPYMFVMEQGMALKKQMKESTFYEVTLEQRWEKIFQSDNIGGERTVVVVDAVVETEDVHVGGRGVRGTRNERVGLSIEVVERIKWEQERVGWVSGDSQGKVRVERVEECLNGIIWTTFECYVLVESFVIKRMDSTVVFTYDFKHTHQIMCKWD